MPWRTLAGSLPRLAIFNTRSISHATADSAAKLIDQRAREVFAGPPNVAGRAGGEGHRDAGESDENDSARRDGRARLQQPGPPAGFGFLHFTAQNQAGTDVPDADQRRQSEQQRRQDRDRRCLARR